MEMTQESWAALIEGQQRDNLYIIRLKERLRRMAARQEMLSSLLQDAFDYYVTPEYGFTLEAAEQDWRDKHEKTA